MFQSLHAVPRFVATGMFVALLLCGVASAQDGELAVGDAPPMLDLSGWCNGAPVLLGDYQQKKVVLVWFFCQ